MIHGSGGAKTVRYILRRPKGFDLTLFLQPAGSGGAAHTVPVTMNEMLLRGCTLKNTGEILGLVVYSGAETRIQQNSAETPLKYGAQQLFLLIPVKSKPELSQPCEFTGRT